MFVHLSRTVCLLLNRFPRMNSTYVPAHPQVSASSCAPCPYSRDLRPEAAPPSKRPRPRLSHRILVDYVYKFLENRCNCICGNARRALMAMATAQVYTNISTFQYMKTQTRKGRPNTPRDLCFTSPAFQAAQLFPRHDYLTVT